MYNCIMVYYFHQVKYNINIVISLYAGRNCRKDYSKCLEVVRQGSRSFYLLVKAVRTFQLVSPRWWDW